MSEAKQMRKLGHYLEDAGSAFQGWLTAVAKSVYGQATKAKYKTKEDLYDELSDIAAELATKLGLAFLVAVMRELFKERERADVYAPDVRFTLEHDAVVDNIVKFLVDELHENDEFPSMDCKNPLYVWAMEFKSIKLDNLDRKDGSVLVTAKTPEGCAHAFAEHDQGIEGSYWECSDESMAYAIIGDHKDLVARLEAEGYDVDQSEYNAPEGWMMMEERRGDGIFTPIDCARLPWYGETTEEALPILMTYAISHGDFEPVVGAEYKASLFPYDVTPTTVADEPTARPHASA